MLKGKKPEPQEKRLKIFIYGPAGVGKTIASLQFPNAYVIDCEKGTDHYTETICKANSAVLQTLLPGEVKAEIRELIVTKHPYKTLIIDPITQVYNAIQEEWRNKYGIQAKKEGKNELEDYGMGIWGKIKKDYKAIQRMLLTIDMNVIITAHQKDVYGNNFSKLGTTFDSAKGDDYFFDLIFQIVKKGDKRMAITIKERAEIGKNKFPETFEWSYENFTKYYGKEIIEKESTPVEMADKNTVGRVKNMVNLLRLDDGIVDKWFQKAEVDAWDDMPKVTIEKCEKYLNGLLSKAQGGQDTPKTAATATEQPKLATKGGKSKSGTKGAQ